MVGAYIQFVRNLILLGARKRGRPPVFNANQFFPWLIERQLLEITQKEFLSALESNIQVALQGETFSDSLEDLMNNPSSMGKDFVNRLRNISNAVSAKVSADFAKQSEMTVGQPYYPPAAKQELFKTWEQNFINLCVSAEEDTKKEISRIVSEGKMKGWNKNRVEKMIREKLPAETKHRAELIARTELGKLNSAARIAQFKEVGIKYYRWLTTIDGRERHSHALMNGQICSVSDPSVVFEETPEGLVEKKRSSEMYIGNPGEDFQCRCSMVSWDPELDGKYQVKGPSAEEIRKKQAEEEEARRKAAEEAARLEQERKEREEAERAARAAAERKLEILRKANERHAKRTATQETAITNELNRRITIRNDVRLAIEQVKGIPDVDTSAALQSLQLGGTKGYNLMQSETDKLLQIVKEINGLTRLDNPMEVAKQWGFAEAKNVNANVERTLGRWAGSSLDEQKHHLEYEIQWVEDNKKYATWKVAQDAYKKELKAVEYKIKWEKPDQDFSRIQQMLGTSKSKAAADAIAELQAAKNADDLPRFEKALKKAEAVYKKLHAKKLGKKAPSSTSIGNHTVYEGDDIAWSMRFKNSNRDRNDFTQNLLIEDVMQKQGFDNLPKVVELAEFKDSLKKDHYLATRTYGTDDKGEIQKLTIDARKELYGGSFYVKCQGGNVHGFGMYFGCDPSLGKNANINVAIWHGYEKKYNYEEFACLTKDAKIIQEDKIEKEFLKRGKAKAPTQRMKDAFDKVLNDRYVRVYKFTENLKNFSDLTQSELDFVKEGFAMWKDVPDAELMKDPSKLPIHSDMDDHGVLAALMGYDALYYDSEHYGVVLNRSKLIILDRFKDTRTTAQIFKDEFGV